MDTEQKPRVTRSPEQNQDTINIRFGGLEANISGFRIGAFAIAVLALMAWLMF